MTHPNSQFGFRKSHLETQENHHIINISEALRNQQYSTSTCLDIGQKNKVWHPGLLYKIKTILPNNHTETTIRSES